MTLSNQSMCPNCGKLFKPCKLIPSHYELYYEILRINCQGSKQIPRCPESDKRPLWNGELNPYAA